jgi:hypothetical protein
MILRSPSLLFSYEFNTASLAVLNNYYEADLIA